MYGFLHNLLSDKNGGEIFSLFGAWHFFYIALTMVAVGVILFVFKGKTQQTKSRVSYVIISVAFAIYILDFFLMPLAYGEIDIEKLPFHACTAMCVMCFLSYHVPAFSKYRISFVLLGFISNFVILYIPQG